VPKVFVGGGAAAARTRRFEGDREGARGRGVEYPDSRGEERTAWRRGRWWPFGLALLLFLGYMGVRHLVDVRYTSIFGAINLGIHEAGHLLFFWTGSDFLHALGGTIAQMAAPVIAAFLFLRQRDLFAACVCGPWLATNMYDSARYIADARSLSLTLVSVGGGDAQHDWHYLLGRMGMLGQDATIAAIVRAGAFICMWGGILAGAYVIFRMAAPRKRTRKRSGPIVIKPKRAPLGEPARSEGAAINCEPGEMDAASDRCATRCSGTRS